MCKINLSVFDYLCATTPGRPQGNQTHQEANFGKLLEPGLRKIFYETYDELPEQYSQVYKMNTSKKAKETDYGLGAMTPWDEFGKTGSAYSAEDMPMVKYATIPSGLERTYVHKEFAKGFQVERKLVDDEQYNIINKMPRDLARAGRAKVESDAASLFNKAFAGNGGYDNKGLISTDHPLLNTTFQAPYAKNPNKLSNRVYGALSDETLKEALQLGRKQYDEAGKLIQMKFDTLIVPPSLEFLAYELTKTTAKPGSNFNDINVLKGRLKVVVLDYLTSDTSWFIQDSSRHELNFFWRVKPEFKNVEDFDTLVQKYRGYMRYSFGYSDFRGIIGSDGTSPKPE